VVSHQAIGIAVEHDRRVWLMPRDAFALRYVRNGPRYFYDPSYDFYWAFAGKHFSAELIDHFVSTIIKEYDPRPRLATNVVPKLLLLGRYDYNIPYREWDSARKTTLHLTTHVFDRSGHFPMLEESALFDRRVVEWLAAHCSGGSGSRYAVGLGPVPDRNCMAQGRLIAVAAEVHRSGGCS
jgi:pimeloyl-ACP methyl ester carboxylesterase